MAAGVCGWRTLVGRSRVGVPPDLRGDLDDVLDVCLSSLAGLKGDELGDNIPLLPLRRPVALPCLELRCSAAFSLHQGIFPIGRRCKFTLSISQSNLFIGIRVD